MSSPNGRRRRQTKPEARVKDLDPQVLTLALQHPSQLKEEVVVDQAVTAAA
jgi:hypothetical protein